MKAISGTRRRRKGHILQGRLLLATATLSASVEHLLLLRPWLSGSLLLPGPLPFRPHSPTRVRVQKYSLFPQCLCCTPNSLKIRLPGAPGLAPKPSSRLHREDILTAHGFSLTATFGPSRVKQAYRHNKRREIGSSPLDTKDTIAGTFPLHQAAS